MNITFLDGYTLNPGDISWSALSELGTFTEYERTAPEEVLSRAADADILIVNKTRLTEAHFSALPKLKLVCVAATGYDLIDTEAARRHGIPVCNAAGYGNRAVAQMAMALLLEATNRVGHYAALNREGFWANSRDFCCWTHPLIELSDKHIAIVGFGNIGRTLSEMIRPFGVKISVVSSKSKEELPEDIEKISIEKAFETCDIVSLNCPLSKENHGFVNAELLSHVKPGLILINTARGGLIDEAAVASALHEGKLGAYACDVLGKEPPSPDNPILSAPRTYVTPHIAWATTEARNRIIEIIANNIRGFLSGNPINVVNGVK